MDKAIEAGIARRTLKRWDGQAWSVADDDLAVEEPLQVLLAGDPFIVTMRTPGNDHELVLGLLLAEGLITSIDDVSVLAPCGEPGKEALDVRPGPGVVFDPERTRRGAVTSSSCGVCGREQIEDLVARMQTTRFAPDVDADAIQRALLGLESAQPRFARTGALHAAIAAKGDGEVLSGAEDVGRHNAVDKVVGTLLRDGVLGEAAILAVSGRVSFEIVQKAAAAGIGAIVAVSGPTSLAVDLARELEMVLVGFARNGGFNLYSGALRKSVSSGQ